ncbi:NifB/NifX family molybdenum-iron cluster-binding protein [Labilibacter marinus]|uniref:NifB/NifX family molybdenum-iron cluster-binding protein n=1 Tax=Labilibacter marinus TaxID=1477105 RepID=UPI00094FC77D|nr:NifB/NifX family molybdenum-iron cluster-binding protein [Labilibacter marinus]
MNQKIAIPVDDNGVLDAHFGHCKLLHVATIKNGAVIQTEKLVPPPHEPGLLPKWLAEKNVTDIIAGGMGQKAISLFNNNKISAYVGAPKNKAEDLLESFMQDSLSYTANYCDH